MNAGEGEIVHLYAEIDHLRADIANLTVIAVGYRAEIDDLRSQLVQAIDLAVEAEREVVRLQGVIESARAVVSDSPDMELFKMSLFRLAVAVAALDEVGK